MKAAEIVKKTAELRWCCIDRLSWQRISGSRLIAKVRLHSNHWIITGAQGFRAALFPLRKSGGGSLKVSDNGLAGTTRSQALRRDIPETSVFPGWPATHIPLRSRSLRR
jgi:hypothetical protein